MSVKQRPRCARTAVSRWAAIAAIVVVALAGCDRAVPRFDQDRAFSDLVRQTEFGPRVPGTPAATACAQWLTDQLRGLSDSVRTESFSAYVPLVDDTLKFTNIVAHFGPVGGKRVLLGAHWDTRPYADMDPDTALRRRSFDGANDGASGVAVALELARALADAPPPVGVDIVLFDGEDLGRHAHDEEWCLGSTHFAGNNPLPYRYGVIVDMVGATGLQLRREEYSYRHAKAVQDRIWAIATELGSGVFIDALGEMVYDDHVPFLMKGIPTVDLIDIRYPQWHTSHDTADKCSAASLGAVGQVLLQLIYTS